MNESDIENSFLKLENAVAQLQQKFNDLEALIKDDRTKTNSSSVANNANVAVKSCLVKSNIKVGDVIKLGKYPQRGAGSLGKDPIEWQVLAVEGKRVLLISKYGLDTVKYHPNPNTDKWASCNLRTWLNGVFFKTAFSGEEAKQIATTNVEASVSGKLFLLSVSEVNKYFTSNHVRKCKATDYAKANGASTDSGNCSWWLRSAGNNLSVPAFVKADGSVNIDGYPVNNTSICVRPALWVNL